MRCVGETQHLTEIGAARAALGLRYLHAWPHVPLRPWGYAMLQLFLA